MHAATAPTSNRPARPAATLAQRITFPTPSAAQAREDLRRKFQIKRARADREKRQQRIAALLSNAHELKHLTEVAVQAAPIMIDEAAWPADIAELSDKIRREKLGLLEATEAPVRNRDREIVLKGLPPCVEVSRDDVHYTK